MLRIARRALLTTTATAIPVVWVLSTSDHLKRLSHSSAWYHHKSDQNAEVGQAVHG